MDEHIETVPILQKSGPVVYVPVPGLTRNPQRSVDRVSFYAAGLRDGIQITAVVGILVYLMFGSRK